MNSRNDRGNNGPTAVLMTMRDGSETEVVFPTRLQAERFLYLLPYLMTTQPHDEQPASAILSPLVDLAPATYSHS